MILLDPLARPVIAHRGNSAHAPENTLAAFAEALALGADALEFDCRLSADGVPVVIHDATLDRTTDAVGPVGARTADELAAIDAGARRAPFAGGAVARVPTLSQVLDEFPRVPLLIEVKEARACPAVRAVLDRHGALVRTVVASFDDAVMAYFRATTSYPTGASRGDVARLLGAAAFGVRVRPRYRVASVPPRAHGLRLPLGRFADLLKPVGVPVHVWTVDDPVEARRYWARGLNGMVSNDPAVVLRVRGEAG